MCSKVELTAADLSCLRLWWNYDRRERTADAWDRLSNGARQALELVSETRPQSITRAESSRDSNRVTSPHDPANKLG